MPGTPSGPSGAHGKGRGEQSQNPVRMLDPEKVGKVSSEVIEGTLPAALDALRDLEGLDRKLGQAARLGDAQSAREASSGLERAIKSLERVEADPNVDPATKTTVEETRKALEQTRQACERLAKSPQDAAAMKEIEEKMQEVLKRIKDCLEALQKLIEALMSLLDSLFGGNSGMGQGGKNAAGQGIQKALGGEGGGVTQGSGKPGSRTKSGSETPSALSDLGKKITSALGGTQVVVVMPVGWETRVAKKPETPGGGEAPNDPSGKRGEERKRSGDNGISKPGEKVNKPIDDGMTKTQPAAGG